MQSSSPPARPSRSTGWRNCPTGGWLELQGANAVSLGQYPNTEDRTATVTVRNAGEGPLLIARVVLTCKCMRVKAFPPSLGPGESGEVAVTPGGRPDARGHGFPPFPAC